MGCFSTRSRGTASSVIIFSSVGQGFNSRHGGLLSIEENKVRSGHKVSPWDERLEQLCGSPNRTLRQLCGCLRRTGLTDVLKGQSTLKVSLTLAPDKGPSYPSQDNGPQ